MTDFLHGIEVIEIDDGIRPISTPKSSVIGLVGTAPDADSETFPLNTPTLLTGSPRKAAKLGSTGTLLPAIQHIYAEFGAAIVVIRVEENETEVETEAETISHIIGGIDVETGKRTGISALLDSNSSVYVTPRLLIAPGFSQQQAVANALISVAESLKAIAIIDGPNATDEQAISYRQNFGSNRAYLIDPWVKVWDTTTNQTIAAPASSTAAGIIAKIDSLQGFWCSPSNQIANGIIGTSRGVDFVLGSSNSRANYLNENEVTTIIQQQGFRLWGNRTLSNDPKWAFLSVRRTADMIEEALLQSHLWAIDRNITKTYFESVTEGVNAYLRELTQLGAILGGSCWVDGELNSETQLQAGKVTFDFDFTPPTPAEHITFRSHLVGDYFTQITS